MVVQSFDARVVGGQLVSGQNLLPLEGRVVRVTLETRDAEELPSADVEPPDDLDIEKDVSVRLRLPSVILKNPILLPPTQMRPSIILPEELPDE